MTMHRRLLHGAALVLVGSLTTAVTAVSVAPPTGPQSPSRDAQAPSRGDRARSALPALPELRRYDAATLALPPGIPQNFSVTLTLGGTVRTVVAELHTLRGPECQAFVDRGDGVLAPAPLPPVHTYRGSIAGVDGARVAVSLIDGKLRGYIEVPNEAMYYVQPASDFAQAQGSLALASTHVIYAASDAIVPPGVRCGVGEIRLSVPDWMKGVAQPGSAGGEGGVSGLQPQVVEIGFDADFEFYQKNGSSVANTINDIETVMNGVDLIYDTDVNLGYEFSTFVIRSSAADPYTTSDMGDLLCEFRTTWNAAPESAIQRDIAQLYTGKSIIGSVIGLAWLGVMCNQGGNDCGAFGSLGYSTVESRYTTTLFLRQGLSAHELGHNWGAGHCDGNGDCHIMCSSINQCDNINGANLKFGAGEKGQINTFKNQVSCDATTPLPLTPPFLDQFPVSAIDSTKWTYIDGAATSTSATNEVSGTRSLNLDAAGSGIYDNDEIRTNAIKLLTFPNPQVSLWTEHKGVESGEKLIVEYWSVGGDWLLLGEITSDGVDQTTFTQSVWSVPTNGKHDGFRLRLRASVNETNDDWYIDDVKIDQNATPVPGNDECPEASPIGVGVTAFNTTFATTSTENVPALCDEGSGTALVKDVWFVATSPCSGEMTVTTCSAAAFDTRLAVYSYSGGCPASGDAPITCSDNFPGCSGGTSKVTFAVVNGGEYLIRLGGATTGGTGSMTVSCTSVPVPSNDECFTSAVIGAGATAFNTATANDSLGAAPPACDEGAGVVYKKDIWFIHQATCNGKVQISTCGTASFDTRISVYQYNGTCPIAGNVVLLGCSDNFAGCSGNTSFVEVNLTTGQPVLIRVGGTTTGGVGTLNLTCVPAAPPCPSDLNGDNVTNGADLAIVLGAWGTSGGDLNGNGNTDGADLAIILGAWGNCP